MTDYSKIIFVNANGDFQETSAADSLKFASFKTANYELTDALLGQIVNAIVTSAGAGDAGKFIKTDGDGNIDASLINDADIDHGSIGGLGDDDHTQYILVAGTRAFTGAQSMGGFKLTNLAAGTANGDAVRYEQLVAVENSIANLEFQDSVIDALTTPPGSPATGDRYLVTATATGAWAGQEDSIAEWDGTQWVFTTPTVGMFLSIDDDNNALYYYTGSVWAAKYFEATTASLGVEKVGMDIRLDLLSGGGLKLTGNEVGVEPGDFAGEGLVDDGSDNLAIDWSTLYNDSKAVKASDLSSTATGKGASIIGLEDASGYTSQTNVEGAIGELYGLVGNKLFTVGAGGVSKGDLVYLSANDTVSKMPINADHVALGLALTTQTAGQSVAVQRADYPLSGVLTGATFGTRYYWDGSVLTTTQPSGSGSHVYKVGVAINATDLAVDVEHIKKNA